MSGYDNWKCTDPDLEVCPDCGGDGCSGCDWEPDYEQMVRDRYGE